jgi:UDPglucose--hexose-1-phosphate uridylyltransferase
VREIRLDPITGRRVLFADERAARPREYAPPSAPPLGIRCPFCPGHERDTPPEVLALGRSGGGADGPGWRVRVVPNKFPALGPEPPRGGGRGAFVTESAHGAHEVVIESPAHREGWEERDPVRGAEVWQACRERLRVHAGDPAVRHVLVFKNHGEAAGATLAHPHLQITALPVVPPAVGEEIAGAADPAGCRFCAMLREEAALGERTIPSGDDFAVVAPYASRFPYELWIVPRDHHPRFEESDDALLAAFAEECRRAAARVASALDRPAMNAVLHTAPAGPGEYHWHLEIIPRLVHVAGFEWGTGMHLNPVFPEAAARRLGAVPHVS